MASELRFPNYFRWTCLRQVRFLLLILSEVSLCCATPHPLLDRIVNRVTKQKTDPNGSPTSITLIDESFDSENGGSGHFHYRGLRRWYVTKGEVDLVGGGFKYGPPDDNLYLDLNGSAYSDPGEGNATLYSQTLFHLEPGVYSLRFDLAGRALTGPGRLRVRLAHTYDEFFALAGPDSGEAFTTHKRVFYVLGVQQGRLSFQYKGPPQGDVLLDNILLEKKGEKTAAQPSHEEVERREPESFIVVFGKLSALCTKALQTQEALLQFAHTQQSPKKGDPHGNE